MKHHHFQKTDQGLFIKTSVGFFGSFITHVGLLLLLIASALNFMMAEKVDYSIFVGDEVTLSDGTILHVDAFSMKDDSGETEYKSELTATLPDGTSQSFAVKVNEPVRVGSYKVYQQSYQNAAVLGVRVGASGEEEIVWLDEPAFLSLDGEYGVYYSQTFGNVVETDDGIAVSYSNELVNPAYEVQVVDGTDCDPGIVYPDTTLEVGDVYYTFYAPQTYPGLRVKSQPEWTLWLLYLSFAVLTLGLYCCFFQVPVAAATSEEGIALAARKDISDWIDQLKTETEDDKKC